MSFEKDINAFKAWAQSLGVPCEVLPNDETLKLILRCPQSNVMQDLINKIKPTKEAENIRKNILISKMDKFKEIPIIAKTFQNYMPMELQRYQKIKQIQKKIDSSEATIAKDEIEVDKLRKKLKEKSIKQIRLMKRDDNLRTRIKIYEAKKIAQDAISEKETKIAKKIIKIMPAIENLESNRQQTVQDVIEHYIHKINKFYDIDTSEENGIKLADSEKSELWSELAESIKTIPNSLLFTELVNNLETNSNELTSLLSNFNDSNAKQIKQVECGFQIALSKAYAYHIRRHLKLKEATLKHCNFQKEYCEIFQKFSTSCEKKCTFLPKDENANSVINNFIENYSVKLYYSGQLNFGLDQIEILKKKVKEMESIVTDHEKLINDTHKLYKEIEMLVFRLQDDCLKLNLLKEKLDSVKKLTESTLLDVVKVKPSQQRQINCKNDNINNGSFRNRSVSLNNLSMSDSFNRIKENHLCSTLIDFMSSSSNDGSLKMSKFTSEKQLIRPETNVPYYSKELTAFNELTLDLLKPKILHFENLSSIFDVNMSAADKEANIFFEMLPGYLFTVNGALEDFKKFTTFYSNLKTVVTNLDGNINLIKVDKEQINKTAKDQERKLNILFEAMKEQSFKSQEKLKTMNTYYDFLLKMPLSKYVPRVNLFNGKTYQDYEAEYMMYYRMLNELKQ